MTGHQKTMQKDTEYGHDKVSTSYTEIGEMERHILSIQAHCRLVASLWLWGTFAGMAYILSENLNLHLSNELIFVGINTTALIGICILWALDLQVYHRQLVWIISEGRFLEGKYSWLPKLRKFRYALLCHSDSSPRMVWYYLVQAIILLIFGAASLATWLYKKQPETLAGYTSLYVIIISLVILITYIITDDKVPTNPSGYKNSRKK